VNFPALAETVREHDVPFEPIPAVSADLLTVTASIAEPRIMLTLHEAEYRQGCSGQLWGGKSVRQTFRRIKPRDRGNETWRSLEYAR
jgi:hypothetical protein